MKPHFAMSQKHPTPSGAGRANPLSRPRSIWRRSTTCCAAIAILAASGTRCHAASPTIDVVGSYFPAWLICIVIGLLLTIIARQIFIAFRLAAHLHPAPVIYPCLTLIFTMLVWLIIFKN